jgi:SAM-dependent methyltransferase
MPRERIRDYYNKVMENGRFDSPHGRLEFLRSKIIIGRVLPPVPASVLDVGGGVGVYSFWLAGLGHKVSIIDLSPRHMELVAEKNAAAGGKITDVKVGDATDLPYGDGLFDAVLLMGPLYHLQDRLTRIKALRESRRVLKPGGVLVAAFICRYAALIDGYRYNMFSDPEYVELVRKGLESGHHLPPAHTDDYFTEAYLSEPSEIPGELAEAGFGNSVVHAVEGLGWIIPGLEEKLSNDTERDLLLEWLDKTDTAPSFLGVSSHFLCIARKSGAV